MPHLRLQKPAAILFDVNGTATNTSFVDRILSIYLRKNIRAFLVNNWKHEQIQRDVRMLRTAASTQGTWPQILPEQNPPDKIQDSVGSLVNHLLDTGTDCMEFAQLRFHVWIDGYEKGILVTPIYSDVAIQMQRWRCDDEIKLYVVSHGWAEVNKVFMSRTNQGDMTLLIDGYFDTSQGQLTDPETIRKILGQIGQEPHNTYFLTKSGPIARAAAAVGILPILVMTHKKCYDQLNEEERRMAIVRTMNEIEFD